jgi:hypothetical protein
MTACRSRALNLTERTIPMFFENEVTRTLTLFEFLLVALIGLAPAAISIWIKPVFARSRVAEDEKGSPAHADRQPPDAAGRAGVFSGNTAAILPSSRTTDRPPASRDIRSEQTAWALCGESSRGGLKAQSEKEAKQSPAKCTRYRAFNRDRDQSDLQARFGSTTFPVRPQD